MSQMKYTYIAVTVKQDRNENIFTGRTSPEENPGFCSYVIKCSESDNIVSKLDAIGGLQHANIYQTKKRAAEVVNFWNECHKRNGQYLFDTERREARLD